MFVHAHIRVRRHQVEDIFKRMGFDTDVLWDEKPQFEAVIQCLNKNMNHKILNKMREVLPPSPDAKCRRVA